MLLHTPFQLYFPEEVWGKAAFSNTYPPRCDYAISIAIPFLAATPKGTFLRQCYSGNDLHIELWSFNVRKEGYIDLSAAHPAAALAVSLSNKLSVQVTNQEWEMLANGRYKILFLPEGLHQVKVARGNTAFLFIIPPLYLFEIMGHKASEELRKAISSNSQLPAQAWLMKDYAVDMTIKRTIKLFEQLQGTDEQLTANLFTYVIRIISHYGSLHRGEIDVSKLSYAAKAAYKAQKYILQNLKEPGVGNIQRLCRMFGISDKPLKREFQLLTSLSIPDFIKEQRLQIGFKVAADPSLSITEMAHIAGYSEPSNFIRDFKKRFGVTPRQAREK